MYSQLTLNIVVMITVGEKKKKVIKFVQTFTNGICLKKSYNIPLMISETLWLLR